MPRTEALEGPIQSARHARAIFQKMLKHRGVADRAYLVLGGKPPWHDDRATFEERYERNKRIADEAQSRLEDWMVRLIEEEKAAKRKTA